MESPLHNSWPKVIMEWTVAALAGHLSLISESDFILTLSQVCARPRSAGNLQEALWPRSHHQKCNRWLYLPSVLGNVGVAQRRVYNWSQCDFLRALSDVLVSWVGFWIYGILLIQRQLHDSSYMWMEFFPSLSASLLCTNHTHRQNCCSCCRYGEMLAVSKVKASFFTISI